MVIFFSVDVSRWWSPFQTVPSPSDRRECLSDIPGVFFFNLSISSYKTQTTSVCVSWSKPNDLSANSRMYPRLYRFPTIWSKGGGKKAWPYLNTLHICPQSFRCLCLYFNFFPSPECLSVCRSVSWVWKGVEAKGLTGSQWIKLSPHLPTVCPL